MKKVIGCYMAERKIIFKARVGSHLHGTSTPKSDEDYLGVYLPSTDELLGIQGRPSQWTENAKLSEGTKNEAGDIDCKYLPLHVFLKELLQGQSQAVELLFIPDEHIVFETDEWHQILAQQEHFISQKSILPIVGFALAQARKATLKGDNLNKINKLIEHCDDLIENNCGSKTILSNINWPGDMYEREEGEPNCWFFGVPVIIHTNEHGYKLLRIAGRDYDIGTSIKRFRDSLGVLEQKYGSRSRLAAQLTYDFKSITHAFRLVGEAEELIKTGYITFPRPDAAFLLDIKNKNYTGDVEVEINQKLDEIRKIESPLPKEPNHSKANQLCIDTYKNHIMGIWV